MAMRPVHLSLDKAPPADVPLRFLLTAPLFGVAAMLAAALAGPQILANRWSPAALAVTHLLVLGYVAMTVFGAQLQLAAVVAGAPLGRPRGPATALHLTLSLGTVGLAAGLAMEAGAVIAVGAVLLALAFGGFIVVIVQALAASTQRHPAVDGMRWSVPGLLIAVALGLALVAGHINPELSIGRPLTDVHLAWGLVGWMGVLVMAVAFQVVPMLIVTPAYPEMLARVLVPVVPMALGVWSVGVVMDARWGVWAAVVTAAVLLVFGLVTLRLLARQTRREPDVSLAYWFLACGTLIAVALGSLALLGAEPAAAQGRVGVSLVVLYVAGFLLSVIGGMVNRIVPFVVWLDLQRRRGWPTPVERRSPVPNVAALIPAARARWAFALHALGVVAAGASPWWPEILLYPATLLLAVAWLLLWSNLVVAVRRGKAT